MEKGLGFLNIKFFSIGSFSKIIEIKDYRALRSLFDVKTEDYWNTHYTFGKETSFKVKKIGNAAIDNILINTVIPILFLYGKEKDNEELMNRALNFLEEIKAENNSIIKKWKGLGTVIKNAYFSQAYIQLYNEYCTKQKCLDCRIAMKLIAN